MILLLSRPDGSKSMQLEIQLNNNLKNKTKTGTNRTDKWLFWLKCESKFKVIGEQLINELKSSKVIYR